MTSNEMTHTPESGAAMPAGLAAILMVLSASRFVPRARALWTG